MNERDDPVLISCLEEVLGGCRPPDLTRRILAALQQSAAEGVVEHPPVPTLSGADALGEPQPPPVQQSAMEIPAVTPSVGDRSADQLRRRSKGSRHAVNGRSVGGKIGRSGKKTGGRRRNARTDSLVARRTTAVKYDLRWLAGIGAVAAALAILILAVPPLWRSSRGQEDVAKGERQEVPPDQIKQRTPSETPGKKRKSGVRQPAIGVADVEDPGSSGRLESSTAPFGPPPQIGQAEAPKTEAYSPRPRYEPQPLLPESEVIAGLNTRIEEIWKQNAITPSGPAGDEKWALRTYQRLVGRIPTENELTEFLRTGGDRRAWLAEKLLDSPEFADYWAAVWTNAMIGREGQDADLANRSGLSEYLRESFDQDKNWDQIAFELISAEGANHPDAADYDGATNFMLSGFDDKRALATDRTARVFLGQGIRCVQCHDHPTNDTWTQNEFWEMNAFLRQMRLEKKDGLVRLVDRDFRGEGKAEDGAAVEFAQLDGTKRQAFPRLSGAADISKGGSVAEVKRRVELAYLVAGSEQLSRAAVNRVWAHFFGYGLTNPVDDMGSHNPPVNKELLEHLATQFRANDHDMKALARWVVMSRPFGLSSAAPRQALADSPYHGRPLFSHFYRRQFNSEDVLHSLQVVTDTVKKGGADSQSERARRVWLREYQGKVEPNAEDDFDAPYKRSLIIEPVTQQTANHRLDEVLGRVIKSKMPRDRKVEHLFLAAVSRKPSDAERKIVDEMIKAYQNDEVSALQDMWWALLNSNEFVIDR